MKIKNIFLWYDLWKYIKYVEDGYKEPMDVTTLTDNQKQQLKQHRKKNAKAPT